MPDFSKQTAFYETLFKVIPGSVPGQLTPELNPVEYLKTLHNHEILLAVGRRKFPGFPFLIYGYMGKGNILISFVGAFSIGRVMIEMTWSLSRHTHAQAIVLFG